MTFRSMMARHARHMLGNASTGHAEPVTYRFASGDPDRTFDAIVRRLYLEPSTPQSRQVSKRRCEVELPRDAEIGVLDWAKGDSIVLPVGDGEAPAQCRIKRAVRQDSSLLVLEVEE